MQSNEIFIIPFSEIAYDMWAGLGGKRDNRETYVRRLGGKAMTTLLNNYGRNKSNELDDLFSNLAKKLKKKNK